MKFSADSKWLASNGDSFGAAKVWKLEPGPEIARFFGASKYSRLAFSSDGQWLAARQTGGGGKNILVWDITTNEALDQSELNETQMASFVFNSDNQLKIAQIDAGTIVISDTTTAQEVSHMVCGEDTAADILDFNQRLISADQTLALSADSKLLANGGVLKENNSYKNMVRVWNVSTCQERNQLPHTYTIAQVAFSPNSQLLAVGTNQIQWNWSGVGEIRIWDVATGHELVFVNSGRVWSLFFSPDSRWLVVNGSRILETKTGREVARVSDMPTYQAAFSPDNRWLATGSLLSPHDEYVSVWAWQPADLIAQACARVSRNLAEEEWQQYLGNEPYRATCPNLPTPHD